MLTIVIHGGHYVPNGLKFTHKFYNYVIGWE
jgi:hypothetical protein